MSRHKTTTGLGQAAKYLLLFLFLAWILIPIYIIFQNSIKPTAAVFADPPVWIFQPTLDHYEKVLNRTDIASYMKNSVIVAFSTMVISLVLGSLGAYSLARLRLRGREGIALFVLLCRMVPAMVLVIPIFVIMQNLGLRNNYLSIIAAHVTFNLPFVVWMMRSFFEEVPIELEDAALVDGCSRLGAFVRIAVPLAAPGLAATAILCLLLSWNEFLFALVLSGRDTKTLPIGIASFVGTVSIDWGGSSAAAVLATIPVFAMGLLVQRYLVRGLTMGAVKG
jgi:multiple sugar transport system permease protein